MKKKTKKTKKAIKLNAREHAVVRFLAKCTRAGLNDITTGARMYKGLGRAARRNWWVRNAVRKPLALGLVRRIGDGGSGTYAITSKGRALVLGVAS